jgi:hypothetical protein
MQSMEPKAEARRTHHAGTTLAAAAVAARPQHRRRHHHHHQQHRRQKHDHHHHHEALTLAQPFRGTAWSAWRTTASQPLVSTRCSASDKAARTKPARTDIHPTMTSIMNSWPTAGPPARCLSGSYARLLACYAGGRVSNHTA